ncbi:hypothetical protein GOBAR_AA29430 [Gossypium barbadense]|uniref:Uncharacterized protein n=1 Tax=Gossypium barbadense TaxID=3634 RepID=A0A2P5WJI0_GOSBA|nr:hypothetical protein GOBAR_AA29430 [Gossypium barbadense]
MIEATTSPQAYQRLGLGPPPRPASVHALSRSVNRLSLFHIRPGCIAGPHPLPSRQFQALFDSLFKVLFIFPSRYLIAIALRGATGAPFQGTWAQSAAEDASPDYNSNAGGAQFSSWAFPGSLAVTRGILGLDRQTRTTLNEVAYSITTDRHDDYAVEDSNLGQPLAMSAREANFRPQSNRVPRDREGRQDWSLRHAGMVTGDDQPAPPPMLYTTHSRVALLGRFSGLLATSWAANRPRRRYANTSPDHSIGRSDGRQIAPPTKNGHAPPPIESRKSSQSVNPYYVWTCGDTLVKWPGKLAILTACHTYRGSATLKFLMGPDSRFRYLSNLCSHIARTPGLVDSRSVWTITEFEGTGFSGIREILRSVPPSGGTSINRPTPEQAIALIGLFSEVVDSCRGTTQFNSASEVRTTTGRQLRKFKVGTLAFWGRRVEMRDQPYEGILPRVKNPGYTGGVGGTLPPGFYVTERTAERPGKKDKVLTCRSVRDYYAGGTTRPIKARSASPAVGTSRPVLTVRRTGRPTPKSNYELFNCNNLNIRYWSWNYRGCWHQTCPPMDPPFLRDVDTAWLSTCHMSNEEAITEHEHHPCQETKCIGIERQGPKPYSEKYFPHPKARTSTSAPTRPHRFKGAHSRHRARLWSTMQPKGHEMEKGRQHIHNSIWLRQLRMQARAWQGQGADGSPTWEAQGVPNMTGENGQAKLEPIAMHKPPQEIFARYRELGPGVVGYISMGTGLTGRKIITLATSAGDRPTTVRESLRDNSTLMGAEDAPYLRLEGGHVGSA